VHDELSHVQYFKGIVVPTMPAGIVLF